MTPRTRTPARKPPVPLEKEVMKQVAAVFALFNLDVQRRNTGAVHMGGKGKGRFVRFGEPGDPDYDGTLPGGRRIMVEVKRPGKRPTEAQYARLRRTNLLGGVGLWTSDATMLASMLPAIIAGAGVEIGDDGECRVVERKGGEDGR